MKIEAIGIVSHECRKCEELEKRIRSISKSIGIDQIIISKVVFEQDQDACMKMCIENDVEQLPSFIFANGIVTEGSDDAEIKRILSDGIS